MTSFRHWIRSNPRPTSVAEAAFLDNFALRYARSRNRISTLPDLLSLMRHDTVAQRATAAAVWERFARETRRLE